MIEKTTKEATPMEPPYEVAKAPHPPQAGKKSIDNILGGNAAEPPFSIRFVS